MRTRVLPRAPIGLPSGEFLSTLLGEMCAVAVVARRNRPAQTIQPPRPWLTSTSARDRYAVRLAARITSENGTRD